MDINGALQDETQLSAVAYTVLYPCSVKLVSESYFIPHLVAKLVLCMQQLVSFPGLDPRPQFVHVSSLWNGLHLPETSQLRCYTSHLLYKMHFGHFSNFCSPFVGYGLIDANELCLLAFIHVV